MVYRHYIKFLLGLLFLIAGLPATSKETPDNRRLAKKLNKQFEVLIEQYVESNDSLFMYKTIAAAIETGIECDIYDGKPDEKGIIKYQYREKNQILLKTLRKLLVDAGLYMYRHGHKKDALDIFDLYINSADMPLFEHKDGESDHYLHDVIFYASTLAYELNDVDKAKKYLDSLIDNDEYAQKAAELRLFCMKKEMKTEEDSLNYSKILLGMHDNEPNNKHYFSMLLEYYSSSPELYDQYINFLNREIKLYPNHVEGWMLIGDECFKQQKWDDAISNYMEVAKLSDNKYLLPVHYNIGICYYAKAAETKKELLEKHGVLKRHHKQELIPIYEQSRYYLEEAKLLDPNRKVVDWTKALYLVYFELGEKKKANEIKHLLEE